MGRLKAFWISGKGLRVRRGRPARKELTVVKRAVVGWRLGNQPHEHGA